MKKALKCDGRPEAITTDGLRCYRAEMNELGDAEKHEVGRWANNRVENSHLPFRRPERARAVATASSVALDLLALAILTRTPWSAASAPAPGEVLGHRSR